MGLWLKKDGEFVPVSGGGGDAGPHDHDYLPLSGGTLTGDLQVDGTLNASGGSHVLSGANAVLQIGDEADSRPYISWLHEGERAGYIGYPDSTTFNIMAENGRGLILKGTDVRVSTGGVERVAVGVLVNIKCDLQVDGAETKLTNRLTMRPSSDNGGSIDYLQKTDGSNKWVTSGPRESDDNSFITYWYDGDWHRTLVLWKDRARFYGDLLVDGTSHVEGNARIDGVIHSPGTFANSGGGGANLHVTSSGYFFRSTTRGGAFAPSKLTRDSDVLERAETATLPPEIETDDDGNQTNTAEVEAHDTVQLFDVVTALLLKVKELSARIEELEGN